MAWISVTPTLPEYAPGKAHSGLINTSFIAALWVSKGHASHGNTMVEMACGQRMAVMEPVSYFMSKIGDGYVDT